MPSVQCPHCSAKLNVPETALGKKGRCPKCQEKFLVQVPKPADEYDLAPLDEPALSAPPPNFDPLAQPLASAAMPLGIPNSTARTTAKAQKQQEGGRAGLGHQQKLALLIGGGVLLSVALVSVIGVLVYLFVGSGDSDGGSSWSGQYAVVDSSPSAPVQPAEPSAPPLDVESGSSPKGAPAPMAVAPGVAVVAGSPPGPPAPATADRSKVTSLRLQPPAAWGVKPAAEPPRPAGPLPRWPHAFAATEAAVITEGLFWKRIDLSTGTEIGTSINLWPELSRSSEQMAWPQAALTRNGQKLALIDAKDPARVDAWDTTGKRLIGLRPYDDEPILWHGWSADGKLLTASGGRLTGWDAETGQAAYEVTGNFAWLSTAPGAHWVLAMTPARHLFFLDTATGQCLGHIPASPSFPEHSLSPDGNTLVRLGQGLNVQVWDLQTGQRKSDRETPLVPISLAIGGTGPEGMRLGVFWIGPRLLLSHTKSPGEQSLRYYIYDLNAHTHTYAYPTSLGTFQNDSLGRAWMTSQSGGGETWIAPNVPGAEAFNQTLAFGPGTTVRVEVDVGSRKNSQKTAEKMAAALTAMGFKIGPGGWVLRADHTISSSSTDLTNLQGQRGISVASLRITWRLVDPEGKEAWKGTAGGKFDPFNSKYVVLGSRKTDMAAGGMGGGSSQVRLDYGNKDAKTAQVEEILENYWYPGVPTCLVKNETGYVALPLSASP